MSTAHRRLSIALKIAFNFKIGEANPVNTTKPYGKIVTGDYGGGGGGCSKLAGKSSLHLVTISTNRLEKLNGQIVHRLVPSRPEPRRQGRGKSLQKIDSVFLRRPVTAAAVVVSVFAVLTFPELMRLSFGCLSLACLHVLSFVLEAICWLG